ncbi:MULTISPECIES: hypothetical protein, partial [unclassified Pseudomonas]|uniref:hypothetical protein n=1 Tax=unclassified Pseudomonas TaxID=196821 RepID=UPI001D0130F8
INPALLPALWVAGWPWNGWPDHRGISGRMFMEWVAGCPWNPQVCKNSLAPAVISGVAGCVF